MLRFVLRNIIRQKTHTVMTLMTITFGVVGIILSGGWVNDIFVKLGEALIHSQSGHIQIYKKGYHESGTRLPEKYLVVAPDKIKEQITYIADIDNVMMRLNFSGLLNNGRSDLSIISEGIEPGLEEKLGSSIAIIAGRQLTDNDVFGILLGEGVAHGLQLKPEDHVTLLVSTLDGALNSMEFKVVGVFQSFSNEYDARTVRVPLAAAQELLGTASVNALVVSLKETKATVRIATLLKGQFEPSGLEIKTWTELNEYYGKIVELYKAQFGVLQLIILVMVLLSVANSINMNIFERIGEFGTMMALGNRSDYVFKLILSEGILLGLIGSSLGVAVGIILALIISAIGIPMPPPPNANIGYIAQIQIVPSVLVLSFMIGLVAATLASILPARHVSRIQVVEALRQNI